MLVFTRHQAAFAFFDERERTKSVPLELIQPRGIVERRNTAAEFQGCDSGLEHCYSFYPSLPRVCHRSSDVHKKYFKGHQEPDCTILVTGQLPGVCMLFSHIPAQNNPAITLSFCGACRVLIAGTNNQKLLCACGKISPLSAHRRTLKTRIMRATHCVKEEHPCQFVGL